MDKATNTPPRELLDRHGNHHEQHGDTVNGVRRFTNLGAVRYDNAGQTVVTFRDSFAGELPLVQVRQFNGKAYTAVNLTPEDAEAQADVLRAAAARAREVAAEARRQGYGA